LEDEDGLHIIVEIAGMQLGEFHVTLNQRQLTISGVRPAHTQGPAAYHQLEVRRGEFRTDIVVPWTVDEDRVAARYNDGFLHVDVPRAQANRVRVVEVEKTEGD
jgi:HSP20 family protein